MWLEGAGLGACEGTADDATGSATFTFKGTAAPAFEESVRGESDDFTLDKVADLLNFDLPSFHYLLCPRFHAIALYASFSDQPYSQSHQQVHPCLLEF